MNLIGLSIIAIYLANILYLTYSKKTSWLNIILIFGISVLLFMHLAPGFSNIKYYNNIIVSENSAPYTAWINFDKSCLSALLIYYYSNVNSSFSLYNIIMSLLLGIFAAYLLSIIGLFSGYLSFEPKIASILPIWIWINLITVISEEAFFRGFLQKIISSSLLNLRIKYSNIISLILTSLIFGLAHFRGGAPLILLSSIAGIFYGYAYQKTNRIESSIITHFIVNLSHIIFFTYPYSISRI